MEHQPQRLATYVKDGSLWENMMLSGKRTTTNTSHQTQCPTQSSTTSSGVSESVGGFNAGLMNDAYTDGYNCPYEIADQCQYEYQRQWFVDPTLKFTCTKTRDD